jgi:CHAT domain-containing protein
MLSLLLSALLELQAAHGLVEAERLENEAKAAQSGGDERRAEALLLDALAHRERLGPDDDAVADDLRLLGFLAHRRDDLERAEARYRRLLAFQERCCPASVATACTLEALGDVALQRVDIPAARVSFERALAIRLQAEPEGADRDTAYVGLGTAARLADDLAAAEEALGRAFAIRDARDPDSDGTMYVLGELATVALDREQADLALERTSKMRAIAERTGRDSVSLAGALETEGRIAWLRDEPQRGLELLERARAILARLAPGSMREADIVFALGWSQRQLGRLDEAARHFCALIDLVEGNKLRSGGSEAARAALADRLGDYYNDCLDLLVDLGREGEAFARMEAARAHRFRSLLREAARSARSPIPAELKAERERLAQRYERALAAEHAEAAQTADAVRAAGARADLRAETEQIEAQIRDRSMRPEEDAAVPSLDLDGARALLRPGSALLAYSVGPAHTSLFVVTRSSVSVRRLPLGREGLTTRVAQFRMAIAGSRRAPDALARLDEQARALYRDLVLPGGPAVTAARRLLICPDGPLHALPFAALKLGGAHPVYLVERTTIHTALSASAYAQILKGARPSRRSSVVAFGDPDYPDAGVADRRTTYAERGGLRLGRLPETRREVERIRELFPQARLKLGREAREEGIKSLGGPVRYLHLACHGLLDGRLPLESGLILSRPGEADPEDDGILHAWEIVQSVRLEADLVTLSACSSGLGSEVVGEGIQGLTRAFHQAGARSVVASLWEVSDRSTATLMGRFYEALRSGRAKDRALADAQRALIRGGRFAHPFHWAAFQLSGDWR